MIPFVSLGCHDGHVTCPQARISFATAFIQVIHLQPSESNPRTSKASKALMSARLGSSRRHFISVSVE